MKLHLSGEGRIISGVTHTVRGCTKAALCREISQCRIGMMHERLLDLVNFDKNFYATACVAARGKAQ